MKEHKMEEEKKSFKAGYVAVIGKPNVGKSTLMNSLLKQKVAAVSPRPQTTRRRQLGILTDEAAQIIFVDTPGVHVSHHKLGDFLNQVADDALSDADLVLWLVDISREPDEEDRLIAEHLKTKKEEIPVMIGFNKSDLASIETIAKNQNLFLDLHPAASGIILSAMTGEQNENLLKQIVEKLPEGILFYEEDQVTDIYERDIAADLIRSAALDHLRDEVPHCMAVRIDDFTERGESGAYIMATLIVEKDSQKGIVIGRGGEMLKTIGSAARREIETMTGRKVYLEMHVKVEKNWRDNTEALKRLGFFDEK
ncbi:MAG: GTPase Era [Anaerolineaceae bacterium]